MRGRRITIDNFLRHKGRDDLYVIGDISCVVDSSGKPMPPNAHIAMTQADIATYNIVASIRGRKLKKYRFHHAGEVVTLGKSFAVGEVFGVRLSGLPAKIMKKLIHLWYLHSIGGFSLAIEGL